MHGQRIGYIRVSSFDQNPERQLEQVQVDKQFTDKASGKDTQRRQYTFSEPDLSAIRQRRGNHNRLGFAVQLCYLRYPGFALPTDAEPPAPLLAIVGKQLRIEPDIWPQYAQRAETRREHLAELQAWLNLSPFAIADYRRFVHQLAELAQQTDRGIVLAEALVEMLRQQRIVMPTLDIIERVCSEALTRHTPGVRGADRAVVRSSPARTRRTAGNPRRHQGQWPYLAASASGAAEAQACADAFGAPENCSRTMVAGCDGARHPSEPSTEARP